jgi:uncharacterized membrane protein
MDLKEAKQKYNRQKFNAKPRGIPFLITFEEWCYVWEQSGKWEQRGKGRGKYVMARFGDKGAYEIGNVFIQLHGDNLKDANIGISRPKSEETKLKMREAKLGIPQSAEHKAKIAAANTGKKRSEETKANMRAAHKSRISL